MFWQFLIAVALIVGLIQLGAMSVWVSVLSAVVKAGLVLLVVVAAFVGLRFVWRRYRNPDNF